MAPFGEPASDSRLMRSASRLGSVNAGTKPAASMGPLRTNKAGGCATVALSREACGRRIGAPRPLRLDAFGWVIVAIARRDDLGRCRTVFNPMG